MGYHLLVSCANCCEESCGMARKARERSKRSCKQAHWRNESRYVLSRASSTIGRNQLFILEIIDAGSETGASRYVG